MKTASLLSGDDRATGSATAPVVELRRNDFRSSTKLDALIQNLREPSFGHLTADDDYSCQIGRLRDQDPYFRAIVFSQFTSFLSLISTALDREHLAWYRFDGSMDMRKRSAAIAEFKQNERKPKVLIVSLKAGGVGLNVRSCSFSRDKLHLSHEQLSCANHVFMVNAPLFSAWKI